jgi:threonine aldolase
MTKERIIDLRSDTVTLPTEEMLSAIQEATLGDDGRSRGDPTVKYLEELAAEKMGMDDGLLVPSGTMGNAVAVLAHTKRDCEVILEVNSHIMTTERAFALQIGRVYPKTIQGNLGYIEPGILDTVINIETDPKTVLVCLENTHNHAGGIAFSPKQMKAVFDVTKSYDLSLHLDGARVFNAAVFHEVDVKELTKYTDSVTFCLSKGLSAPVGSVLCGDRKFISRARFYRKLLGGTMRQAGIIAAPGIIAIEKMVDRLKEDHRRAKLLEKGLIKISGIKIMHPVQTNLIFIDVKELGINANQFRRQMENYRIKTGGGKGTRLRVVTHRGIMDDDISYTLECIKSLVESL